MRRKAPIVFTAQAECTPETHVYIRGSATGICQCGRVSSASVSAIFDPQNPNPEPEWDGFNDVSR